MIYFADDGSYGDAFNMVILPGYDTLTVDEWKQVEEASDSERVAKVVEILHQSGAKAWVPNVHKNIVEEIVW